MAERMSDLRLHDPLLVLRYGLRHQITRKPRWEWVENFVNNSSEMSQIIHALKSLRRYPLSLEYNSQIPPKMHYSWTL